MQSSSTELVTIWQLVTVAEESLSSKELKKEAS